MATLLPLSDGCDMPQLCLGAFRADSEKQTKDSVKAAYHAGIRHFEIAELFGNGHMVTRALSELHVSRKDVYLTLKLWPKSRKPSELVQACKNHLGELEIEYVDLIMVHAPIDVENKADQWKALEELKDDGYAKSLGVASINAQALQELLKNCRLVPTVFEMEVSPFSQKIEMVEFCSDSSMIVLNNEPLNKGLRNQNSVLMQCAQELGISVTRLLLQWSYTMGFCIGIPQAGLTELIEQQASAEEALLQPLSDEIMQMLRDVNEELVSAWIPDAPPEEN